MVFDSSHEDKANGEDHPAHYEYADDRLDTKYRYWSFMESHPAHTSLPLDAHQDAIDALNWASTDGLLLSHRSIPAPFTREECQSLTTFLRSVDQRGETPLRTRTISKILLRIVSWRQSHFRPDKPLPVDADREGPLPVCGGAFRVYAFFVAVIALCLPQYFMRIVGIGAIFFCFLSPQRQMLCSLYIPRRMMNLWCPIQSESSYSR
ncbi:hypothetical protein BD779DRAFT_509907 [Infundibulicybe gibba]|nr:hypothetical protein BD779DRAFT_509907 [Infundibulicybe gibba]